MSIHLEIGGVDYSAYIRELDLEPSGPGKIGTGTLRLSVPGSAITDRMTVKVWRVDGSGYLVRRYFGGYVGGAGTGRLSVTPTKTWDIPLQDYSLAGKRIVADVDLITDSGTVLGIGTFAAQVADAVNRWQTMNGTPSVVIDATSKVVNLTGATVLPAIPGLNGKSLDFVLQQICNNARVVTPALRPRWRWGYDNTFGAGAVFGPPVLWVYNAADVTSTVAHFSDALGNILVGTYKRTTQSPALVNRRQSVYGDPLAVVTSAGTASHSTYPFDLTGDGYWGDESLEDKDSTTSAQAQAVLDRNRQATEYPRETVELSSRTWAEPGETVLVTWAGDGLSAVGYRVAGVRLTFLKSDADTPICAYTLGTVPREVGVVDGDTIGNPPVVGDHVAPGMPTALGGTSAYDGATHTSPLSGTFIAPLDSDYEYTELRYKQRLNGGAYGAWAALTRLTGDPGATQTYTIPGLNASSAGNTWETFVVPQAYDHNHNGSAFGASLLVTNASVDNPNPPTGLAYTTVYYGGGVSQATVTWVAGAQPPTRGSYLAELTAPSGRTYVYSIKGTATAYTFKNLSPGLVYSLSMVAVTPYGDSSLTPATLSITAASGVVSSTDPPWHAGDKDSDTSDALGLLGYKLGTAVGTHVTAIVSTTVVYDGIAAFKFVVGTGGSGDAMPIVPTFTRTCAPSQVITLRWREGNATNATGTLAVIVTYYNKSGTVVGSPATVYSAAPSTAAGVLHEVQVTIPGTSTITTYGVTTQFTTSGTANGIFVGTVTCLPTTKAADLTTDSVTAPALDIGYTGFMAGGSMEVAALDGLLPAGFAATGTYSYLNTGLAGVRSVKLGTTIATHTLLSPYFVWTAPATVAGAVLWFRSLYQPANYSAMTATVKVRFYDATKTQTGTDQSLLDTNTGAAFVPQTAASGLGSWLADTYLPGASVPAGAVYARIIWSVTTTTLTETVTLDQWSIGDAASSQSSAVYQVRTTGGVYKGYLGGIVGNAIRVEPIAGATVDLAPDAGSGTGTVNVSGTLAVGGTGAVTAASVTATGAVAGASVAATGAVTGASATITNDISGRDLSASRHWLSTGSAPGCVKGAAVGTGTATLAGTDVAGTITFVPAGILGSGLLATVTFAVAFASAPKVVMISAGDVNSAGKMTAVYADTITTTTWKLTTSLALTAATTYIFNYFVPG